MDRAIIFLRSVSTIAERLAINMVRDAIRSRQEENVGEGVKKGANRIRRNTPAATRVEECTKAETGVGAAIAAGSHLEKGSWALLVIPAIIRVNIRG